MSIPLDMYHVICIKRLYKTFSAELADRRLNSFSAEVSGPRCRLSFEAAASHAHLLDLKPETL